MSLRGIEHVSAGWEGWAYLASVVGWVESEEGPNEFGDFIVIKIKVERVEG